MYIQHKNLSRLPVTAIERAERIDTLLENERALMREIIIGGHATETRMVPQRDPGRHHGGARAERAPPEDRAAVRLLAKDYQWPYRAEERPMTVINTIGDTEYTGDVECNDSGRYTIRTTGGKVFSWTWGDKAVLVVREPYARFHPLG